MRLPQDARLWTAGGVVACAVALGAGYLLLVGPKLSAAADQQSVAADAQSSNDVLRGKVATLRKESAQQATYVAQLGTARAELPVSDGLAAFITQLQAQATATKVSIGSITVGAVGPVIGPAASTAPAPAASTDSASTSSASTTTATPAAAPVAAGPAGQLYQIQVTVLSHGSLVSERAFLTALRKPGSRAALVNGTQWSAGQPATAAAPAAAPTPAATGTPATTASTAPPPPPSLDTEADLTTTMNVFAAPQSAAAATQLTTQLTTPAR